MGQSSKSLLTGIAIAAATASHAALVLDDFVGPASPGQIAVIGSGRAGNESQVTRIITGPLAATRVLYLRIDSVQGNPPNSTWPSTGSTEQASVNVVPGNFALTAGPYADTSVTLTYDNNGSLLGGGAGIDLAAHTAIEFAGVHNTHLTEYRLVLSDGTREETRLLQRAGGFTGSLLFSLTDFAGGGLDLSAIRAMRVRVDPQEFGGTVQIGLIQAVPEPSSGLVVTALCALGLLFRRRALH